MSQPWSKIRLFWTIPFSISYTRPATNDRDGGYGDRGNFRFGDLKIEVIQQPELLQFQNSFSVSECVFNCILSFFKFSIGVFLWSKAVKRRFESSESFLVCVTASRLMAWQCHTRPGFVSFTPLALVADHASLGVNYLHSEDFSSKV
jgi:hypothetical protein